MKRGWWSQRFAPEGSAAAEGIAKQLGIPSLDPLTVLVREAAQNSWDARRHDVSTVDFRIGVKRLGDDCPAWRRHLLPAPDDRSAITLERGLHPEAAVVTVSDRGTVGLGGPLRAGHRATGSERPNFVQFLRNVGEPSDHALGGGTYGFGKGIFFRLSTVATMLVDTHTVGTGPAARRLMGAALGRSWYDDRDLRYTGRHWWGEELDDVPDPLTGATASDVAADLGMPGFSDGRTGTDIVILAADLGSSWGDDEGLPRSPAEAGRFIASSMLWNLWPKMIDDDGPVMRFAVDVEGDEIDVPAPADVRELRPFVDALRGVRTGQGLLYTRTVEPRNAGVFDVRLLPASTGRRPDPVVAAAAPIQPPFHHVARMRTAELIVDYLPGPVHPDPLFGYAGVFKASETADAYFAGAEPPTHDDWVEKSLTGTARGVVQGGRRFILKQLDAVVTPSATSGDGNSSGLGEVAHRLAGLIPGGILAASPSPSESGGQPDSGRPDSGVAQPSPSSAAGASTGSATTSTGRGPNSRGGGRPRIAGSPVLQIHEGTPFLIARVTVPAAASVRTVEAEARVVVDDGGLEAEPPPGAPAPTILQWRSVEHDTVVHGSVLRIPEGDGGDWWVYSNWIPDAVIRFRVRLQADPHAR